MIALREKELSEELKGPVNHHPEEDEDQLKSFVVGKTDKRPERRRRSPERERRPTPPPAVEVEIEEDEGHEPDVPPENQVLLVE